MPKVVSVFDAHPRTSPRPLAVVAGLRMRSSIGSSKMELSYSSWRKGPRRRELACEAATQPRCAAQVYSGRGSGVELFVLEDTLSQGTYTRRLDIVSVARFTVFFSHEYTFSTSTVLIRVFFFRGVRARCLQFPHTARDHG